MDERADDGVACLPVGCLSLWPEQSLSAVAASVVAVGTVALQQSLDTLS